ncbi:MAG: FmdB family transcriptional regulator [Austwickia sp.]|nr:FmdB family transcriptional regulator [Austwickia sp.]MBK8436237.1 FmdB family transcriptional regulator [Austwickia sp.]MBK9101915.1 FmdB family transcriptional regulator [Austwickia sp.]
MPTYAYACTECGHHFEIVQSFTDDSLTECPQCQGRLRKLFNAVGVVFKGSGFYRTDSRKDSERSSGSSTSSGSGSGSAGANGASSTSSSSSSSSSSPSSTSSGSGSSGTSGTSASTSSTASSPSTG